MNGFVPSLEHSGAFLWGLSNFTSSSLEFSCLRMFQSKTVYTFGVGVHFVQGVEIRSDRQRQHCAS